LINQWHEPKLVAKWLSWPLMAYINTNVWRIQDLPFHQSVFDVFLTKIKKWLLTDQHAKIIFDGLLKGWDIETLCEQFSMTNDNNIDDLVQGILRENPDVVTQYRTGKKSTIGFFIWQAMKQTNGHIDATGIKIAFEKALNT
jgi:aspartyl-tRNA(Asn)/glutamyl-tRNA(Gln) amidotransferase subunit B